MANAGVTIAAVFAAALFTYLFALRAWRRQQRREVYAVFIAAAGDWMGTVEYLFEEPFPDGKDLTAQRLWPEIEIRVRAVDRAWGEVLLIAPRHMADQVARIAGSIRMWFLISNEVRDWDDSLTEWEGRRKDLSDAMVRFTETARRDLGVESWWSAWWRACKKWCGEWFLAVRKRRRERHTRRSADSDTDNF